MANKLVRSVQEEEKDVTPVEGEEPRAPSSERSYQKERTSGSNQTGAMVGGGPREAYYPQASRRVINEDGGLSTNRTETDVPFVPEDNTSQKISFQPTTEHRTREKSNTITVHEESDGGSGLSF